jgi:Right handed beta helix region
VVEYSLIEYEKTSRDAYTNGVDVHTGDNWVIRHNLFRNVRAPQGQLAGPAILMWNGSTNTLTEGNTFIDCQREIAYGLQERTPDDHTGGIIRNNFIYRNAGVAGDAAIGVFDSPRTQVLHNTILGSGTYRSLIEYRFAGTTGVVIANNLLDGSVLARDGATGSVTGNYGQATASLFVNAAAGDLHLLPGATPVIDRAAAVANCPDDWDGQPRPQGSAPDTGADEYVPGTVPPAPPRNLHVVG